MRSRNTAFSGSVKISHRRSRLALSRAICEVMSMFLVARNGRMNVRKQAFIREDEYRTVRYGEFGFNNV